MNDTIMTLLRSLFSFAVGYAAAKGLLTPTDATALTQFASQVGPVLIPAAIALYSHWGLKRVPVASVAVIPTEPKYDPRTVRDTEGMTVTGKVVGALLIGFLIVAAPDARAQNPLPSKTAVLNSLASWADDDLNAAIALAGSQADMQDGTGAACWKTVQSIAKVVKAHPLPLTLKLASDLEAARLVTMGLNQICTDPNCAQVWNDINNTVAALAVLPPMFQPVSICSKIPAIKSVPVAK